MTRQEIETALKLCSSGLDPNCAKCVYAGKGYYRALMRDVLRYIGWLKNENKNGKTKPRPRGKVPENGNLKPGAARRSDLPSSRKRERTPRGRESPQLKNRSN